jgi:hypothetical protein
MLALFLAMVLVAMVAGVGFKLHAKPSATITKVQNKMPRSFAAPSYYHIKAALTGRQPVHYLFTEREINLAKQRAEANPEDYSHLNT